MLKMYPTRLAFALFVGLSAVTGYAPQVLAHAKLTASEPSPDAVVAPPQEIVLTFSQAATPLQAKLTDLQNNAVSELAEPKIDGVAFHYTVGKVLAPGKYEFSYRVVTPDTHVSSGTVGFSVAVPGAAK